MEMESCIGREQLFFIDRVEFFNDTVEEDVDSRPGLVFNAARVF